MIGDIVALAAAAVIGFLAAGFIALIIWTEEISPRLQDLAETYINQAYEPAAYKAAKELTETGGEGHDFDRWRRTWKPIIKLRRLWTTKTQNRFDSVHYSHYDRFPYVQVEVDWKAGYVRMWMPLWSVVLLDDRQQELDRIGAKTETEAYSTGRDALAEPHHYFRHDKLPRSFLVLDPKGKVVGPEEPVEAEPQRSGAVGD